MPRGDGTGPLGSGPRTGRGRNNCSPNLNFNRPFYGRGNGRGLGLRQRSFYQTDSKELLEQEKQVLQNRIEYIDSQIKK